MTYIFDEYGERHRFDAFCKTVLRYEAINYFRELNRQRKYSIQFNALSQSELGKLYTVDEYPSDSFIFSAFGYVLYLHEEMMADAFSRLPESMAGAKVVSHRHRRESSERSFHTPVAKPAR